MRCQMTVKKDEPSQTPPIGDFTGEKPWCMGQNNTDLFIQTWGGANPSSLFIIN